MNVLERIGLDALGASPPLSDTQSATSEAFGYKWAKRETYESTAMREQTRQWLLERYCGGDAALPARWLEGGRRVVLDAGCGSGFTALLLFGELLRGHDYVGMDISNAVTVAEQRFADQGIPGHFIQADLSTAPLRPESVDIVYSEGVLHHTDDTMAAFRHLAKALRPGGRFLCYVYRKKGPIREFTDDYLRHALQNMDEEQAWRALEPLTKLGKAIGDLEVEIDVPEDIPLLGIKAGKQPLQRLIYWNIMKIYYRPEYSMEEMNHINFDWYRPLNCHRHTEDEVRRWCDECGLDIERLDVQEAGITVVARKRSANP